MLAFLERLIDGFLAKGYSLERPDELEAAVVQRLKDGPGPRGSGSAGCNWVAILALLPSPQRLTALICLQGWMVARLEVPVARSCPDYGRRTGDPRAGVPRRWANLACPASQCVNESGGGMAFAVFLKTT